MMGSIGDFPMKSKPKRESLVEGACRALGKAANYAFECALPDGHWYGELRSNVTITAEYILLRQALGLDQSSDSEQLRNYFLSEQNPDGSWGIAPDYPGDVSTSTEAYFALKILNVPLDHPDMCRARDFIQSVGGIAKARIFTRIYLATFGLFPWSAIPEMPAELILLPSWAPINLYVFSSWARSTIVPLLIVCHHRPLYALPNGIDTNNDYLDELWCNPSDKNVPYCPSDLWNTDKLSFVFSAIDSVLHYLGGLRYFPLRKYAISQCLKWVLEHQEEAGDWAGIFPPMHLGILALLLEGYKLEDPQVYRALEAIERFAWEDDRGKRVQSCVSPVWDTVLMTIGLCDAALPGRHSKPQKAMEWVRSRQLLGPEGDWRIYNPRLLPGGFSFEYHNTWYPDVDDTAAAIIAFIKQEPDFMDQSITRAVIWVLGMQNRDGGFAAFDLDNDKFFLNKIPFSDMNSLCDPSSADVTGRVLEAFGLLIQTPYKKHVSPDLIDRILLSTTRAITYLASTQEPTGAWYGRWGSNYIYGTSNTLCALAYWIKGNVEVQDCVELAVLWLRSVQNPDGGWGEGLDSYKTPNRAGCGPSTASQTAWALMGLLPFLSPTDPTIEKGVRYLISAQSKKTSKGAATWPETLYTGTGFPEFFYIGYSLYSHYFPMMALGRYAKLKGRMALRDWKG
ncbi:Terpenoid cyclases/protein prenyltransferase alpha-alpha toroid [Elaphomyces granulatus]